MSGSRLNPVDGLPQPKLIGSAAKQGGAYVFLLPFDIYVASGISSSQIVMGETKVRLYPPYRNSESSDITLEQADLGALPYPPGTARPNYDKVRTKELRLGRKLGDQTNRADAIRLDITPNREADFVVPLFDRLVGLIRWWTSQWWIKRDRRYDETALRNWYPINELGERTGGVHSFLSSAGFIGIERPLDADMWPSIRSQLLRGRTIPLSRDLLFDGIYFNAVGDLRRAVLETAIGCEIALDETLNEMVQQGMEAGVASRILGGNDFLKHLRRTGDVRGRSFENEHKVAYEAIRVMWIARGHVAHGEPPRVPSGSTSRELNSKDMAAIFRGVVEFYQWLAAIIGSRADES
jgi:hypothetical protein